MMATLGQPLRVPISRMIASAQKLRLREDFPEALPSLQQGSVVGRRERTEVGERASNVDGQRVRLASLEEGKAIIEIARGQPAHLEEQEKGRGRAEHATGLSGAEELDLTPPPCDALDEEVSCGIQRFDGQAEIVGQTEQREPIGAGTLDAYEIDILGDAPVIEPECNKASADQEPVAGETVRDALDDRINPTGVHLHRLDCRGMPEAWEVLCMAGVPDRAARSKADGRLESSSVARALGVVVSRVEGLDVSERECLTAWLAAFRHHWPDRFSDILGPAGESALARMDRGGFDPNRYLKLRRIATENLALLV
jgi:hypothetical protein